MTRLRAVTTAVTTALLITLTAGCATVADANGGGAVSGGTTGSTGYQSDDVVLRVSYVGGFVPAVVIPTRVPAVSVFGDGRVVTEGPQIEIFPPPALPNLQLQTITAKGVDALVKLAAAAGVGASGDFGRPNVSDMPSTRFVLLTPDGVKTTEVYALGADDSASDLTPAQREARAKLRKLLDALGDLPGTLGPDAGSASAPYVPSAIAAVSSAWTKPSSNDPVQPEIAWPGPTLPGESMGNGLGLNCVTATGDEATRVLAAAKRANALTPWVSGGKKWTVTFRPLLPDEHTCADLRRQS